MQYCKKPLSPLGALLCTIILVFQAPALLAEEDEVYTYNEGDSNEEQDQESTEGQYSYEEDSEGGEYSYQEEPAQDEDTQGSWDAGETAPGNGEGEGGLEISGSLLSDNGIYHYFPGGNSDTRGEAAYAGVQRFSLRAVNRDREKAKLEADISLTLLNGKNGEYYNQELAGYGLPSGLPIFGETPLVFSVKTLSLSLFLGPLDLSLGRRIINFGTGFFFSPLDLFSRVDLSTLSYDRVGSDILQGKLFFGPLSGLEAAATLTTSFAEIDAAVKLFWHLLGFDWAVLGIRHGATDEWIAGLSFVGDIEIGIHGELGVHAKSGEGKELLSYHYVDGMIGLDYSFFRRELVFMTEYYFNTEKVDTAGKSAAQLSLEPRFYFHRHYLFCSAEWSITELMSLSASSVWNVEDSNAIVTAQYTYDLFQNTDLSFYGRYFLGQINGVESLQPFDLQYGIQLELHY